MEAKMSRYSLRFIIKYLHSNLLMILWEWDNSKLVDLCEKKERVL